MHSTVGHTGTAVRLRLWTPCKTFYRTQWWLKQESPAFRHGECQEVFLPQRDGIEAALLEGKSEEELIEMIFALDHDEVLKADIVFMNLDGRVPDEGACVELGMAYVAGKRCYGFKTDTRSVEKNMDLNPLIAGCMIKIFKNYDGEKLIEEIKAYLAENDL